MRVLGLEEEVLVLELQVAICKPQRVSSRSSLKSGIWNFEFHFSGALNSYSGAVIGPFL